MNVRNFFSTAILALSILVKGRGPSTAQRNGFWGELARRKSMQREGRGYAEEGYQICVVAYRCVDVIAKALATIPMQLVNAEGDEVDTHKVLDLLKKPNPLQGWPQLCRNLAGFYGIAGNSYMEFIKGGDIIPGELWIWQPYAMQVVEPRKGFIPVAWVYEDGEPEHRRIWEVDLITGSCDLLQWKTFSATSLWFGMSPMQAAAYAVDQHNGASVWNQKLLDNNASPSGALVTEKSLTEEQFGKLKEEMATSYQGAVNSRRPMLLEGGLKWEQYSFSPQEMDWLAGKLSSAQDVAAAYGVPLQVIPLPGSQTFANYEEARLALWEDVVIPLHRDLCEALTTWLLPKFEGTEGMRLQGDMSKIPALEKRRADKATAINQAGYMTLNEKRESVGLPTVDDPAADVLYSQAGMLPIGFDNTEGSGKTDEDEDPEVEGEDEEDDTEEEDPAAKKPIAAVKA